MKSLVWFLFYLFSFAGIFAGMYFGKEKVLEKTKSAPVLDYLRYEPETEVPDSTYTETIDSLAVVIEGLLGQLGGYVEQVKERDKTIFQQKAEIARLKAEYEKLKKRAESYEKEKENFSKAQDEKKIQDLAKMLSSMKVDELGVILKNFPDDVVQIVYDKASNKDRVKILKALGPDRGSDLLLKMAESARTKKTGK